MAQKYLSPELTTSSEQVMMDSKGEQIIVPIQQTIPVSYEVEVEEGCRFSVPPEMLTHIRDGDRIR